jgi:phospholipase C
MPEVDNYATNLLEMFKNFQSAPVNSTLFQSGMRTFSPGQFEWDAMHDRLPTVSWLIPTSYQSEHPDYTPAAGADFVASKIDAIAANPDVWAKTVFILNYDENDGLFDHVVPPTPPAGTPNEFITVPGNPSWPIGAGFRVPCLIVSPWTQGGWIASETFDHTSSLQSPGQHRPDGRGDESNHRTRAPAATHQNALGGRHCRGRPRRADCSFRNRGQLRRVPRDEGCQRTAEQLEVPG